MVKSLAGGGKTKSKSSSSVSIPSYLKTANGNFVSQLNDFSTQEYNPFTGQAVAPLNDDQLSAIQGIRDLQGSTGEGFDNVNSILSALQGKYANGVVTPDSIQQWANPFQQQVTDIDKREAVNDFSKQLQSIQDRSSNAGSFGGSRGAIVEAMARQKLNQNLQDIQTRGSAAGFTNAQNMALQAGNADIAGQTGIASALGQSTTNQQASALTGINALMGAGATQQQNTQAQNNFDYSQYQNEQAYDQQHLGGLLSLMQPYFGSNSKSTQTQTASLGSTLMGYAAAAGSFMGGGGGAPSGANGFGSWVGQPVSASGQYGNSGWYNSQDALRASPGSQGITWNHKEGGLLKRHPSIADYAGGGVVEEADDKKKSYLTLLQEYLGNSMDNNVNLRKQAAFDVAVPSPSRPLFFDDTGPEMVDPGAKAFDVAELQEATPRGMGDVLADASAGTTKVDPTDATVQGVASDLHNISVENGLTGFQAADDTPMGDFTTASPTVVAPTSSADPFTALMEQAAQSGEEAPAVPERGNFLGFSYDKNMMALAGGILANSMAPPGVALGKGIQGAAAEELSRAQVNKIGKHDKLDRMLRVIQAKNYSRQVDAQEKSGIRSEERDERRYNQNERRLDNAERKTTGVPTSYDDVVAMAYKNAGDKEGKVITANASAIPGREAKFDKQQAIKDEIALLLQLNPQIVAPEGAAAALGTTSGKKNLVWNPKTNRAE